jgi:hypothetical protein
MVSEIVLTYRSSQGEWLAVVKLPDCRLIGS